MTLSFEARKAGLLKGSPCAAAALSEHPPGRRSGAALTRAKPGGAAWGGGRCETEILHLQRKLVTAQSQQTQPRCNCLLLPFYQPGGGRSTDGEWHRSTGVSSVEGWGAGGQAAPFLRCLPVASCLGCSARWVESKHGWVESKHGWIYRLGRMLPWHLALQTSAG